MVVQWYYYTKSGQVGPVDEATLFAAAREGRFGPEDFVWNPGLGRDWAPARTVPGLFAPPPLPAGLAPTPGPAAVEIAEPPSSLGDCAQAAWERTKVILFRPVDLGKWFVLGFVAWLATLGDQGTGVNVGGGQWQEAVMEQARENPLLLLHALWDKVLAHLPVVIGVVSAVLLLSLALGLVMLWLRCRGVFMFLDNVVHNRAEVAGPWRLSRTPGHSLFWWTIVFQLVVLALWAVLIAAAAMSVIMPGLQARSLAGLGAAIGWNAGVWLVMGVAVLYVRRFLTDFVVPIMYWRECRATDAWAEFLGLMRGRVWRFVGYGVFYFLLSVAAGVVVIAGVLLTCCIGGCLLVVPYIGTVALLPVLVFFRCFSLCYLGQFGAAYRGARTG